MAHRYMRRISAPAGVLALLAVLLCASRAHAQSVFEQLVMPGPVIEGHARLEKSCNKCHEPFAKASQKRLCLDCHKPVATDIARKTGFHGRRTDVAQNDCRHCHTEHKGRGFDIVQLDRETFDHRMTDFALNGAHAAVACAGCHKPKVKFRDAPATCVECHKLAEPHKGRLGDKCEGCHNETTWRKTKPFDHAKTKFPLIGAHQKVACATCHAGEHYKDVPTACIGCHQIQDRHAGRYGTKCETCHAPQKWTTVRFDHDKATKFPLKGRHKSVKCDSCHAGDLYRDKLSGKCVDCHRKNDPHKGQLGVRCGTCHDETGWRKKVAFDHDVTRFPLIGLHAAVPCENCHRTPSFKNAPLACVTCHKDDHHKGRLGTDCARCHNPNGWALWRFDHTRQTSFALTGAHTGLACESCHKAPARGKVTAPKLCVACHKADDVHSGSFGPACDQCHSTTTFRQRGNR